MKRVFIGMLFGIAVCFFAFIAQEYSGDISVIEQEPDTHQADPLEHADGALACNLPIIAIETDGQEIQKEVIKGCYSTDVSYNYKAALADTEKNLIGFPGYENTPTYYLYSYDAEHGFTCLLKREMSGYSEVRGLYSKDKFYLVTDGTVESYSLETMEKIDDLVL